MNKMPVLTVIQNETTISVPFEGEPVLSRLLSERGIYTETPCGGRGTCLKCAVRAEGTLSLPDETEKQAGTRLACRVRLLGDATVWLPETGKFAILSDSSAPSLNNAEFGYGAAVDIGTTTVVLKLFSGDGTCVGEASALNPQRSFSQDVIGRISKAMNGEGEKLKTAVIDCIQALVTSACKTAGIHNTEIDRMVITGNTAMLYLLTGRDPASVSRFPFKADCLFGEETSIFGIKTYLVPCVSAFVGGDTVCALLACGMLGKEQTALLCDIGTNGEIALYKNGALYVTSVAAGPAFEGGEISCGCGGTEGAVYRVWAEEGNIYSHTVGNKPAIGICGSGLIDAANAFLQSGYVDADGKVLRQLVINAKGRDICLCQNDIRALQLAKSAVAAGIECMLSRTETDVSDIKTLYIAGAFGTKIDPQSAVNIGLFPSELKEKVCFFGNGALSGAVAILFDKSMRKEAENIAAKAVTVPLGGSEEFNRLFIKNISFPK